ncbi:hypothetical protein GWI33_009305 [Rhynchophorus ferrugineus]|uniref:Uncharacterized protein n=1 Tax=Rhynchophorus ferrugineus TaxID=354439 RepID=A0A834MGL9_RHYFE|nr:hypothetical protein GWI33_009305 [Rhynchophorus ferrugineus]
MSIFGNFKNIPKRWTNLSVANVAVIAIYMRPDWPPELIDREQDKDKRKRLVAILRWSVGELGAYKGKRMFVALKNVHCFELHHETFWFGKSAKQLRSQRGHDREGLLDPKPRSWPSGALITRILLC